MAVKKNKELNVRKRLFCAEYVADPEFNAAAAAQKVGISPNTARKVGCLWLQDPLVQAEIDRLTHSMMYQLGVTSLGVVAETKALAYSNFLDYGAVNEDGAFELDLTTTTRRQMAAVQEIITDSWTEGKGEDKTTHSRTKIKLHAKLPALELLGRRLNTFPQKVEVGGKDGGPIHFTLERIAAKK